MSMAIRGHTLFKNILRSQCSTKVGSSILGHSPWCAPSMAICRATGTKRDISEPVAKSSHLKMCLIGMCISQMMRCRKNLKTMASLRVETNLAMQSFRSTWTTQRLTVILLETLCLKWKIWPCTQWGQLVAK